MVYTEHFSIYWKHEWKNLADKVFPPFVLCLSLLLHFPPSIRYASFVLVHFITLASMKQYDKPTIPKKKKMLHSHSLCPSVLSLTLNDRCLFAPFSFLIDKLSHDDQVHSVETHENFSLFLFLSLPLTVQAATIESEDFVVHLPSKLCELRRRVAPLPLLLPIRPLWWHSLFLWAVRPGEPVHRWMLCRPAPVFS